MDRTDRSNTSRNLAAVPRPSAQPGFQDQRTVGPEIRVLLRLSISRPPGDLAAFVLPSFKRKPRGRLLVDGACLVAHQFLDRLFPIGFRHVPYGTLPGCG